MLHTLAHACLRSGVEHHHHRLLQIYPTRTPPTAGAKSFARYHYVRIYNNRLYTNFIIKQRLCFRAVWYETQAAAEVHLFFFRENPRLRRSALSPTVTLDYAKNELANPTNTPMAWASKTKREKALQHKKYIYIRRYWLG